MAPRTSELDNDPAFRDACGTQSYPRLVLAGVRLRVGWTVLALALACELPQYLLLWSFYADDGWPIPARRETDDLPLAVVYAAITALLAWLSRRYSHRKNELVPTAACAAICAATWAPLPGPDWAAGGGFVYAIASMGLAWSTLRSQARSRRYPDEYFEPAAYAAFLRLQPRSGDRARYAFRGRSVAGARAAEVMGFGLAAVWLLGVLIYAGWYYSRPKPDMEGFAAVFSTLIERVEAGDREGVLELADRTSHSSDRRHVSLRIHGETARILSYRHAHFRGRRRSSVSIDAETSNGSLDVHLYRDPEGTWRWSNFRLFWHPHRP